MNADWMRDPRKIPDDVMNFLRRLAVSAVIEKKQSIKDVATIMNLSQGTIRKWVTWYRRDGEDALDTRKAPGAQPIIDDHKEIWLKHTILNSTPMDFGYDTFLWTLKLLADVLKQEFGITVYESTIWNHLQKLGLSCQAPTYRAYGFDPDEADAFLEHKWPMIQKLAKKLGADVAFEDEAGMGVMTRSGRTWGAVNATPVIPASDQRGGVNILSAVTPEGIFYDQIEEGHITSQEYIDFLDKMITAHPRPLILVVDRASFHRSRQVRKFVREHREKIRIFFLPRHAPHMNPDEQVWNELKHRRLGREPIKNKQDLKRRLLSRIRILEKSTTLIQSFFRLPDTKYVNECS